MEEQQKHDRIWRVRPEWPFLLFLVFVVAAYLGLLLLMVGANVLTVSWEDAGKILKDPDIQHSIKLTFVTCTVTAILSVLVSVPVAYLLSRYQFRGRAIIDTLLDIPILLPPLIVGLSLLILFNRVSASDCCWMVGGGFLLAAIFGGKGMVRNVTAGIAILLGVGALVLSGFESSL
ncbi:hypothetical protein N9908_01915, partial [Akkermansiaceae bacterium]|nr:hypothetical protein [Akkermansiaceae bacterium]